MSEKNRDRRSVIKGLVLTSSGVAIGSSLLSQAQAMFEKSIEIGNEQHEVCYRTIKAFLLDEALPSPAYTDSEDPAKR